jgi:leucyl aminopeptidase
MDIKVVKSAASVRADIVCRFLEAGSFYDLTAKSASASDSDRAELITSGPGNSISLTINISALRDYEIDEARRSAAGAAVRNARKWSGSEQVWLLDGNLSLEQFSHLASGLLLTDYEYTDWRASSSASKKPRRVTLVAGENTAPFKRELERLTAIDSGVRFARDLVNRPPNDLYPESLAQAAKEMCAANGLTFKLLNLKQLEQGNYIGLTSVGKGSRRPPVMFTMSYTPAKVRKGAKPLCLVGKGITFDTGGISIKPWDGMWDMKGDMGGAAAVIGAMRAIAALQPGLAVTAVVASAENMPDGNAYRPGDILRYRNGRTVEIHSTDAEGRLVLADALIYAQETLKQSRIVEFSTLTGACVRALGHQYIGLFSKSADLLTDVQAAAEKSGEAVWQLPMNAEYRAMIKSSVADIKNVGGALAGASTAAMFLQEFIQQGTQYAHLDIAGAFLADKADKYYSQPGATGCGVRLAAELAARS